MKNDIISPEYDKNGYQIFRIRSFVRHQGRLTKGQQHALDNFWPEIGVEFSKQPLNYTALFDCKAPVILEIGFGMGASLVAMAKANSEKNFFGIEVYTPGIGSCIAIAYKEGVKNLRIICHDAVEVLHRMIPNSSLDTVQLFFPDPWYKTRHNKRRIVQTSFAELVKSKLKLGGFFHMATDCLPYAKHMLKVISLVDNFENQSVNNNYIVPRPESRPITKFEQRSYHLGYSVWDLIFKKVK